MTPSSEAVQRLILPPGAAARLRAAELTGRLGEWFPDLARCRGVEQPKEHHWDVLDHSIETVDGVEVVLGQRDELRLRPELRAPAAIDLHAHFAGTVAGRPRLLWLKLAALLHDVGKPATRARQPDGRIRFFGHAELGAELAERMLARLGFEPAGIDRVALLVHDHLRPGQIGWPTPTARAIRRFFRELGDAAVDLLVLNLADHRAMRGPALTRLEWVSHRQALEDLLEGHAAGEPPIERLLTGDDLMAALDLPPGPAVGRILQAVEAARERGHIRTRAEALAFARALLDGGETSP
ncbi:MAG: HD domain-containing protein [Chloroflexi bacterium]|nr:HD domain-containing protein [Chloroflexota bacterium]